MTGKDAANEIVRLYAEYAAKRLTNNDLDLLLGYAQIVAKHVLALENDAPHLMPVSVEDLQSLQLSNERYFTLRAVFLAVHGPVDLDQRGRDLRVESLSPETPEREAIRVLERALDTIKHKGDDVPFADGGSRAVN